MEAGQPAVQGYLTWYALEVGCRLSSLIEPDSLSEPVLCPFFVDFSGGDSDHRLLGLVEVGRVGISMTLVEKINKEDQSGLRWGEAVALRPENVDVLRRRVHVRESATLVNGELVRAPRSLTERGRWSFPASWPRSWLRCSTADARSRVGSDHPRPILTSLR